MRWGGQADGLDVRAEGEGGLQLQHSNIVVSGHRVVVWRHNQRLDVNRFGLGLLTAHQSGPHQGCPLFGVVVPINRQERDDKTFKYTCKSLNSILYSTVASVVMSLLGRFINNSSVTWK